MRPRVLVAGVGNVFLGDDGFGVEVARRLASEPLPEGVRVEDFGIRGIHLAYELLEGYDAAILVDATPRGGPPGSLYVIEPDLEELAARASLVGAGESPLVDAHGMEPASVFAVLQALGGRPGRVVVVGCEPADVGERMGLSEPVARAVEKAVRAVKELVEALVETPSPGEIAKPPPGRAVR
ncbi:MAG TPA: hydrogenase maturation protease [Actinomycetota bacterium]|nr:hydrogenase maturation protease [Actinomycetota bacterium]